VEKQNASPSPDEYNNRACLIKQYQNYSRFTHMAITYRYILVVGLVALLLQLLILLPRESHYPVLTSPHYPSGYSLPSYENIIVRKGFTASVSYRYKMPNWVAEVFTREDAYAKAAKRAEAFRENGDIPNPFRADLSDYASSGWSRGHLAPVMNHRSSRAEADETFVLSDNIIPQDMSMNGCDWLRLEEFAQSLIKQPHSTVNILSGPLWLPDRDPTD